MGPTFFYTYRPENLGIVIESVNNKGQASFHLASLK